MSDLEARYRRALRWYPKRWRAANADAVVGTLLDAADDDRRSIPARGELANLYKSGLRTRFAFVDRVFPRAVRAHAAAVTLGLGFGISVVGLFFGGSTWVFDGDTYRRAWFLHELTANIIGGQGIYLVWLLAGVAAVIGLRRIATGVLMACIPISIVWPGLAWMAGRQGHPGSVTLGFLDLLAIVAIAGLSIPRWRYRIRVTLSCSASIIAVVGTLLLASRGYWGNGASNVDFFWAPFAVWLVFLGIPFALILAIVFSRLGKRALAGGILLAAAPVIPLGFLAFTWRDYVPVVAGVLVAVIIGATLSVLILRAFGLRVRITRV